MSRSVHLPIVRVPSLAVQHDRRLVYSAFVFLASGLSIATITSVAFWSGHPLVVPSLGPTAFLVFNRAQSTVARPRNIVLGHLIGALTGYLAIVAFGLEHAPSIVSGGLTTARIGAAALSISLASGLMILLRAEHGPAGATTLIVSLGFMTSPGSLGLLMAGVVFLAILGVLIDRGAGLPLPYWAGQPHTSSPRPASDMVAVISHATAHAPGAPRRERAVGARQPAVRLSVPGRRSKVTSTRPRWLVGPGEGRPLPIGAERSTVKVQDARAAQDYSVLEVELDPSQPATLLHAHYDFAETYFVLDGALSVEVGTEQRTAPAGSTICVPPGIPHRISAAGRHAARCLCVTDRSLHSHLEYLP